jgi:4-aminobutyrate aminotransferase
MVITKEWLTIEEAALKIARHSTKRQLFIGFTGSFHGRTFGTMAFSSTAPVQRCYFHPLMPLQA